MIWKNIKLGASSTFVNGYAFKPTQWSDDGMEIIRIANLTGSNTNINYFEGEIHEKYKVSKGDILISWSATLGIFEWNKEPGWLNQHIFKVVFEKEEFDKSFFKHLINSILHKLEREVHGSTMLHITKKRFDDINISIPPLETQKRIAQILDDAQALKQKTEQLLNEYDTLAQSIFLDMFGDIHNNIKYPKWTIGDFTLVVRDGPHVSPQYSDIGIPILSTRNIRPFQLVLDDVKYVSEEVFEKLTQKFKPQRGDVIITKGGTTGFTKKVDWDWDFCIWVHLAILRIDKELVNATYVEAALNSYYCYRQSQELTRGIANKDLGLKRLISIELPNPPISLQNQFAEKIALIEKQKELVRQELKESEDLFNCLLQKAFKGELI